MKRIKATFACLMLVTALGTASYQPTANAQEPGPQGGGDTIKRPSCYPLCRPVPTTAETADSTTATEEAGSLSFDEFVRFILNLSMFT